MAVARNAAKANRLVPKKPRRRALPGATSTRKPYTGMSGQFLAMSEFLWRGYNVAIPAVDVGEDIFVVEAENGVLRRVQVKTAGSGTVKRSTKVVQFQLSRTQLRVPVGGSELFFVLLARWDDIDPKKHWRFLVIRRDQLDALRVTPVRGRRGRRPVADTDGAGDDLNMTVTFTNDDATAWGHSLRAFLDVWPLPDWTLAGPMRPAPRPADRLPRPPVVALPPARIAGPGTTQTGTAAPGDSSKPR